MCCNQNGGPTPNSIEYVRRFKPENNFGCCGSHSNDCDSPSLALEGSPLWNWEQVYGKLIHISERKLGSDGRYVTTFSKVPCPKKTNNSQKICCSLNYRVAK